MRVTPPAHIEAEMKTMDAQLQQDINITGSIVEAILTHTAHMHELNKDKQWDARVIQHIISLNIPFTYITPRSQKKVRVNVPQQELLTTLQTRLDNFKQQRRELAVRYCELCNDNYAVL
jgi:hypothetical protein